MKKTKISKIIISLLLFTLMSTNSYSVKAYSDFSTNCNDKLSFETKQIIENSNNSERIPVTVWIDDALITSQKPNIYLQIFKTKNISSIEELQNLSASQKFEIVSEYRNKNKEIMKQLCKQNFETNKESLESFGSINYVDCYAPFVCMELTKTEIKKLSTKSTAKQIFYTPQINAELLLQTSKETTRAELVQTNGTYGETGNGVKLGLIDRDLPFLYRPSLIDANIICDPSSSTSVQNLHASYIAEIMVGQGSNNCVKGIAPDATLYCTAYPVLADSFVQNITWLIDNNVDIVNISIDLSNEANYNSYDATCFFIDYYSSTYLMTFVVACGNFSTNGVSSPAIAYNTIAVGNLDDQGTSTRTDDQIHNTSSHINQLNANNLPSKPDICAPGTNILLYTQEHTGTSYASPHVAAAAALLGEMDPLLLLSPVALKAALVTGTNTSLRFTPEQKQLTTDTTNPPESYIQCGAGLLDCVRSGHIAKNYQYDFSVFGATKNEISFTISLSANKKTRISIAFEKNFTTNSNGITMANNLNNLDLYVYDGQNNLVASSTTTNNNVEIVDFTPTTSGSYTVKITRQASSNPTDVRYAYAWLQG